MVNWWPWTNSGVSIKIFNNGNNGQMGCGGCGQPWMSPFMRSLFCFQIANNFLSQTAANIGNILRRDGAGGAAPSQPLPFNQFYAPQQQQGFFPYVNFSNYGAQGYPMMGYGQFGQYGFNSDGRGGAAQMRNLQTFAESYKDKCTIAPLYDDNGNIKSYLITGKDGNRTTFEGSAEELGNKLAELYPAKAGTAERAEENDEETSVRTSRESDGDDTTVRASEETDNTDGADGVGDDPPKAEKKFKKGDLSKYTPAHEWKNYNQLTDEQKKKFKDGMTLEELRKTLMFSWDDHEEIYTYLRDANPTAIVDDKVVNVEKLTLPVRKSNPTNSTSTAKGTIDENGTTFREETYPIAMKFAGSKNMIITKQDSIEPGWGGAKDARFVIDDNWYTIKGSLIKNGQAYNSDSDAVDFKDLIGKGNSHQALMEQDSKGNWKFKSKWPEAGWTFELMLGGKQGTTKFYLCNENGKTILRNKDGSKKYDMNEVMAGTVHPFS